MQLQFSLRAVYLTALVPLTMNALYGVARADAYQNTTANNPGGSSQTYGTNTDGTTFQFTGGGSISYNENGAAPYTYPYFLYYDGSTHSDPVTGTTGDTSITLRTDGSVKPGATQINFVTKINYNNKQGGTTIHTVQSAYWNPTPNTLLTYYQNFGSFQGRNLFNTYEVSGYQYASGSFDAVTPQF